MTDRDTPSYRAWVRTPVGVAVTTLALLAFVYSVVIAQQLLLGVLTVFLLTAGVWSLFLLARFVRALERIADAAERLAASERADGVDGNADD